MAYRTFDQLVRDGYLRPTWMDLADREGWIEITDQGLDHLRRGGRDEVDEQLLQIGPQLVSMRQGMWEAVDRSSPDAARQAANSARELIDQTLKEGAPGLETRKARVRQIMRQSRTRISDTDVDIIEACANLVDAEARKLLGQVHGRHEPNASTVRPCIEATERLLRLLFGIDA